MINNIKTSEAGTDLTQQSQTGHRFIADIPTVIPDTTMTVEEMNLFLKQHNGKNRKFSKSRVDVMKQDIANGNWNNQTYNPVKFLKTGEIGDGQHRMKAHVELNMPMRTMVVCGLDRAAINYFDNSFGRNYTSRKLFCDGIEQGKEIVSHTNQVARLARACLATHCEGGFSQKRQSDTTISKTIEEKKRLFDELLDCKGVSDQAYFLTACGEYIEKTGDEGREFLNDVNKGTNLEEGTAKYALNAFLHTLEGRGSGGSFGRTVYQATVTAINANHAGMPMTPNELKRKNARLDEQFNF